MWMVAVIPSWALRGVGYDVCPWISCAERLLSTEAISFLRWRTRDGADNGGADDVVMMLLGIGAS